MYAGKDPLTGKERYERETAPTYQAAEVALTRLQARVDEDRQPKADLTVRQAIDQWLEVAQLEDTTRTATTTSSASTSTRPWAP